MVRCCAIVLSPCVSAGCRLDLSFASDTHHLPACQTRCSARPSAVRCSVQQRYKRSAILPIGIACVWGSERPSVDRCRCVVSTPHRFFRCVRPFSHPSRLRQWVWMAGSLHSGDEMAFRSYSLCRRRIISGASEWLLVCCRSRHQTRRNVFK